METFSALLTLGAENSPVTGEFPSHRPVTQSFDIFFDLRPNKRFSNNREAGDLRHHRAHNDVIVMGSVCLELTESATGRVVLLQLICIHDGAVGVADLGGMLLYCKKTVKNHLLLTNSGPALNNKNGWDVTVRDYEFSIDFAAASHDRYCVLDYWKLNCLFNGLLRITA